MSDLSNLFFFRDIVGYDDGDKFDRIPSQFFNLENNAITEYVDNYDLDTSDLENPGKTRLTRFMESELDDSQFENLIDELFEKYGENGDTFNIKAYNFNSDIDENTLVSTLEGFEDNPLMSTDERESFSYLIEINDFENREEGVIDIWFEITGKKETYSPEGWFVELEDGEQKLIAESVGDDAESVGRTDDYMLETRIYTEAGLLAVTNSDIDKTLQEEIRAGIQRWGRNDGGR